MPETDVSKAFAHLHKELVEYQLRLADITSKGAALSLLVIGWMLTSEPARTFIATSRVGRFAAVAGITIMVSAYILLAVRMTLVLQSLGRQLQALDYFPPSYYSFRVYTPKVAIATAAIVIAPAGVAVVLMLFGV
ncbi:MAG: hypothetical protein ACJ76J_17750 [Thermoanaerobaculia bacterium]